MTLNDESLLCFLQSDTKFHLCYCVFYPHLTITRAADFLASGNLVELYLFVFWSIGSCIALNTAVWI